MIFFKRYLALQIFYFFIFFREGKGQNPNRPGNEGPSRIRTHRTNFKRATDQSRKQSSLIRKHWKHSEKVNNFSYKRLIFLKKAFAKNIFEIRRAECNIRIRLRIDLNKMTRQDEGQRNIYSSSGNFNSKTRLPQIPEVLKIDGIKIIYFDWA